MIDTLLAAASVKAIEDIMTKAAVPYEIRKDEETGQFYGEQIQENAINLIAQLAIRGDTKAQSGFVKKPL